MQTQTVALTNPNEHEVEEVLANLIDAIGRKDLDAVMACYADGVVAFDVMPPLRHVGAAAFRRLWEQGFSMPGHFALDRHHLVIEADETLAFAYGLDHVQFEEEDGTPAELWMRWTGCLKKFPEGWRIVHEQTSVPADVDTGRAFTTLVP